MQRLRDLGWFEGRTVSIEYRWGGGRTERTAEFVTEFVQARRPHPRLCGDRWRSGSRRSRQRQGRRHQDLPVRTEGQP